MTTIDVIKPFALTILRWSGCTDRSRQELGELGGKEEAQILVDPRDFDQSNGLLRHDLPDLAVGCGECCIIVGELSCQGGLSVRGSS